MNYLNPYIAPDPYQIPMKAIAILHHGGGATVAVKALDSSDGVEIYLERMDCFDLAAASRKAAELNREYRAVLTDKLSSRHGASPEQERRGATVGAKPVGSTDTAGGVHTAKCPEGHAVHAVVRANMPFPAVGFCGICNAVRPIRWEEEGGLA